VQLLVVDHYFLVLKEIYFFVLKSIYYSKFDIKNPWLLKYQTISLIIQRLIFIGKEFCTTMERDRSRNRSDVCLCHCLGDISHLVASTFYG